MQIPSYLHASFEPTCVMVMASPSTKLGSVEPPSMLSGLLREVALRQQRQTDYGDWAACYINLSQATRSLARGLND
jgi:hypothetical protein